MSVAAVVTYRPGEGPPTYLPVATEAAFRRTWLPVAVGADLELVPRFAEGVVIETGSWDALAGELAAFVDAAGRALDDEVERAAVTTRATQLADLVRDLLARPGRVEELFIG